MNWLKTLFKQTFVLYGKPGIGIVKFGICKNVSGIIVIDDIEKHIEKN